jgi:hypothetical protein
VAADWRFPRRAGLVTRTVDSAVPSASGTYPLTWQGRYPVSPVVRLAHSSSAALLQDWVVIFAVAFGITGSVLASLLSEWLRRPSRDDTAPVPLHSRFPAASRLIQGPSPREVRAGWLALAGAVFLVEYAQGRRTRARHR